MKADDSEEEFIRHWSERVYDQAQLAQIQEIERHLIGYAMDAWRPMTIVPPVGQLLLGACGPELVLMTQTRAGEWRNSLGHPHKPPDYWMPAPRVPKTNGRGT